MGGPRSTRWKDHQKAGLVEDAHQLDVASLEPALKHDQITGLLQWTDSRTETTDKLPFSLGPVSADGTRILVLDSAGSGRRQRVRLERDQRGWYSGWIFRCPSDCERRVRKLFALPRWMVFSCRRCGGLSYRSAQQHDSRLDFARRDPVGFLDERSRAPKTPRSEAVTAWLAFAALDREREPTRGRTWGKRSTTAWSRAASEMRAEFEQRP